MNDSNNKNTRTSVLSPPSKDKSSSSLDNNQTVIKPAGQPVNQANDNKTQFKPDNRKKQASIAKDAKTVIKPASQKKTQQATSDKTQIKPREKKVPQSTPGTEKLLPSNLENNEDALTRIDMAIRAQNNTQGFKNAQKAADSALASNKIVIKERFVLESTLGAGGMGAVYRARDLRKVEASDLQPYIAVKVLNEDFKNHPDAFVSLQREASRSSMLAHPHNVIVYDFDRDGDIYYMTMELLKGRGLEAILREHKNKGLPVEQALKIIDGYCQGLIHAHSKNIVHSDLKPGNLFVDDNGGTKVLDYGIARITNEASTHGDYDAGTLGALTPAYASLEMFNGDEPHPSDDVYAAAIIAYELFSGRHPYDRIPANEAFAQKLRPKRLTNLSKQQWSALESGLQLTRSTRTQNLTVFRDKLIKKKKTPIFKFLSAALFCITLTIGYFVFFGPDKMSIQAEEAFQKANDCFAQQDFECALDKTEAVLVLLPEHAEALILREKIKKHIFQQDLTQKHQSIKQCIASQDVNCAERELLKLKAFAATSETYTKAQAEVALFKTDYKRSQTLAEANTCFNNQNYVCAKEKANLLLYINNNDSEAQKLIHNADEKLAEIEATQNQLNKDYAKAYNQAKTCHKQKRYQCAIAHANQAIKLKPESSASHDLLQQAKVDLLQQESNLKNAINMVKIGDECLKNVKYRCAIASAESALASVPNYPPALELKQKAKQAQRDVINQDWKLN